MPVETENVEKGCKSGMLHTDGALVADNSSPDVDTVEGGRCPGLGLRRWRAHVEERGGEIKEFPYPLAQEGPAFPFDGEVLPEVEEGCLPVLVFRMNMWRRQGVCSRKSVPFLKTMALHEGFRYMEKSSGALAMFMLENRGCRKKAETGQKKSKSRKKC